MKIKLLAIILLVGSLYSCSSIQKTSTVARVETSVLQYPTVTDLTVSPEKVEKSETWEFHWFEGQSDKVRKENLMADLLKETGADVLLEPNFKVEKHFLGPTKITVTGYPAKFKDFRKATPEDIQALRTAYPYLYNVAEKPGRKKCK